MTENLFMLIFIVVIALLLILDLFVLHKKDHEVTFKESARQTAVWVSLAMLSSCSSASKAIKWWMCTTKTSL